MRSALEN